MVQRNIYGLGATCPHCAAVFVPYDIQAKYCSLRCREAAHRARRRLRETHGSIEADGTHIPPTRENLEHTKARPGGTQDFYAPVPPRNPDLEARIEAERQRLGLTEPHETEASRVLRELGFTPKRAVPPPAAVPMAEPPPNAIGAALNAPLSPIVDAGGADTPADNPHGRAKNPT